MSDEQAKALIDKVIGQVFGLQNPYSLEEFAIKFAFDLKLTTEVTDYTTGEPTWAQSTTGNNFIKFQNLIDNPAPDESMIPKRDVNSVEDILRIWQETSVTTTERHLDSINVGKSDAVYGSQNVYRSIDVIDSKNIAFCNSVQNNSEFMLASQRSGSSVFSIRVIDSKNVSNSFNVSWSKNVSNSFFVRDCSDIADCMFVSQVSGRRFCIANMQFEEKEYRKWEAILKKWILSN